MPKGENSGGPKRRAHVLGKDGHDMQGYGLSIIECADKLGMTKAAVWEMERMAIRRLWRMGVPGNRDLHRDGEKQLTRRIEALKCSTSN